MAGPTQDSAANIACDINNAKDCYDYALKLHYGQTVPKDKVAAHATFVALCENNLSKACHAAAMRVSRYSENPDYDKALYLQKRGCETGTARSCFVVARSLEAPWGKGVEPDFVKSKDYFNRACDLGMGLACGYAEVDPSGYRLK